MIATESKGSSEEEFGLSDSEKEQLMNVEDVANDVQKHSDKISDNVNFSKE